MITYQGSSLKNAMQSHPVVSMPTLCVWQYLQTNLAGIGVWLICIYVASLYLLYLLLLQIIFASYNTEPISHAHNVDFSARLYFN